MGTLKSPGRVIEECAYADGHWVDGHRAVAALREAGWHLVSTPEWVEQDNPPIPDSAVESHPVGQEPYREITLSCIVDDDYLSMRHHCSRWSLLRASWAAGYLAATKEDMVRKLMDAVAKALAA